MSLLITRTREDAASLANSMPDIPCFIEPMFSVIESNSKNLDFSKFKLVICTSKHVFKFLSEAPFADDVLYCAIGDTTSELLREMGKKNVYNAKQDIDKIIDKVLSEKLSGEQIIYLRGNIVAHDLLSQFMKFDLAIKELIVYEIKPALHLSSDLINEIKIGKIDAAVFFSKNTAKIFISLLEDNELLAEISDVKIFAISNEVAQIFKNLSSTKPLIFTDKNKLKLLIKKHYRK